MPDPILMTKAILAAAVAAAAIFLLLAWPWRGQSKALTNVGATLAVGLGVLAGCWVLELYPQWPPLEDIHRLLAIVLPAAVIVELIGTIPRAPKLLMCVLRVVVGFGVARVLLHNSIYITNLAGPGSAEWSPSQAADVLLAIGGAITVVYTATIALAERSPSRALPIALSFIGGGAALSVMLSGYATGGQLGLALGGALMAVGLASFLLKGPIELPGALGVGVVLLGSLLVVGRFFGELTTPHLAMLLAAPLLLWIGEIPALAKRPAIKGIVQVLLVSVLVGFVVFQAQQRFVEKSQATPKTGYEEYGY